MHQHPAYDFPEGGDSDSSSSSDSPNDIPVVESLDISRMIPGSQTRWNLVLGVDGLGFPITCPVVVVRGRFGGPVLGITSALHGNELNGIPLLHKLIGQVDVAKLKGTIVAVPVLNGPGFLRHQRGFHDNQDLNRLFPGKPHGNCGQQYAHNILHKLVVLFDYHVDLHTASFGRVNSLYVRADMNNPITNMMARLQEAQIIVHNTAPDGSLRSAAMNANVPSVTLEIGDPSTFHREFIDDALIGMERLLSWLHMTPSGETQNGDNEIPDVGPTVCSRSFWIYAQHGGLLEIMHSVASWVKEGEKIARVRSVFGDIVATYTAPQDGIIVGHSSNPVCSSGDRVLHLGVQEGAFPRGKVDDGH